MPKRLTDTDKWKKPLLKAMPAEYKLLWLYICDDCNHAGIWHVDIQIASLRIGENVTQEKAVEVFGKKIVVFDEGEKWFIPGFIEFQYGELNPKNRVHESVLKELNKYDLRGLQDPSEGAKDKDKDKDMDMDKEKDKANGAAIIPQMQAFWKKENKNYPTDLEKDTKPLLAISKFICQQSNIRFTPADKNCQQTILHSWQHLCEHIPKHKLFKNYNLQQVEKYIQSIVLDIQNGTGINGKSNQPITGQKLNEAHAKYFGQ